MSEGASAAGERPLSITAVVLTFDEALHIERCLANVAGLVERIVVVDSFSKDGTVETARRLGADVYQRHFKHQADQFQWALENCAIASDWVLKLDADEYLEAPLVAEIRRRLPALPAEITGVRLKRKMIFRERWIRHGGYYPTILLRLWRTGAARIEQRWMDEHAVLLHGSDVTFDNDFVDHNLSDIAWWTEKHNRYSTRQMVEIVNREYALFPADAPAEAGAVNQRRVKRFLRNSVFGRAPMYLRGVLYFLYRYVVRLGFLDGRQGFAFHFLQGCWNWVLVDAKIDEARAFIRAHGLDAFKEHLRVRHRIEL